MKPMGFQDGILENISGDPVVDGLVAVFIIDIDHIPKLYTTMRGYGNT